MSTQSGKLCSVVIEETFGVPVKTVADVLITRGPTSLRQIFTSIGNEMPVTAVKDSLKTLIQHFVVTYHCNSTSGETIYEFDHDRAIELIRFSRYYELTDTMMGPVGREVLEEVVQASLVPISKLIYICGFRVMTTNPETTASALNEKLTEFNTTVLKLVMKKFIVVVPPPPPPMSEDALVDVEEGPGGTLSAKDLHKMPDVDLKLILAKLLDKKAVALESLPDAGILWGANISHLQAELRNNVVYSAIERKYNTMIDTRVIQIIIDAGFEKHPWEDEGTPVSLLEIKDRLEKLPNGAATSNNVSEHIEVVEDDPKRILNKLSSTQGGYFSFNMKIAVTELFWSTVDRIITDKHGFHALRIFRLIKDNIFAEQDSINELGMIPGKDAKHLTYQLVADHFINIKEVKKSYTANAPPGKMCHVFYVDTIQVVRSLQEIAYKAILNMKLKSEMESVKITRLSVKEERINRILDNMRNKNCTDVQLEEIGELLTPPERSMLMRYQFSSAKLLSGTVKIEETLFITELFMKYCMKKMLPKAAGKREPRGKVG